MTKTEQKVFDYAQGVDWDEGKIRSYIINLDDLECNSLPIDHNIGLTKTFIQKHKPKDWREGVEYNFLTITLPIDDYNRLRKLEIKQQIKKLKKELKGL